MGQWDEDGQEWVSPPHPHGPPPGSRRGRLLIVALAVAVLAAAAGTGIWLLARDDTPDRSDGPPGSYPTTTASGSGAASDPCAAVDATTARQWGLDAGRPDNPADPNAGLKSCQWTYYGTGTTAMAVFHLIYTKDVPMSPSPTPIPVAGVPSATASGNANGCAVLWPTSFGQAIVHVAPSGAGPQRDLCGFAADFAAAVAPGVPH